LSTAGRFPVRRKRPNRPAVDNAPRLLASTERVPVQSSKFKGTRFDYVTAIAKGWPIATGIIEGACRHLVKDRMDLTGARWSLDGAEAVLRLRSLRASGDFEDYMAFHQRQERQRNYPSAPQDDQLKSAA
ncbi:MAG: hypothetical protein NFW16_05145, partial [Candidatus Accumulibacter sp.]|nr:hypothetical protein [Accumulibacter sp.]